jgi:uncharacterized protein
MPSTQEDTMATIPTGRFVWFDYVSKDAKKAQAFFGELFHWKTKPVSMPHGSYTMITVGDTAIGGYLDPLQQGGTDHAFWLSYLQVANVKEAASKVKSLGGNIAREPHAVGSEGSMAVVGDPHGALFALWQPTRAEPGGDYKGIDGSWVWNELYTPDPDKALAFYEALGGFHTKRMPLQRGGPGPDRYDILESDGKGRAGVMSLEGVPPNWMPYVKVANTDETIERAKRLGASFKTPAETVENVGRFTVMIDPLGAPLGILQPQPSR